MTTVQQVKGNAKNHPLGVSKTDQLRTMREEKKAATVPTASESKPAIKEKAINPAHKIAILLSKAATRIERFQKKLARWDVEAVNGATMSVGAALTNLKHASQELQTLPVDWTPPTAIKGAAKEGGVLAVGDIVSIRDKYRSGYEDVLAPEEFVGLKVLRAQGKNVIVQTTGGDRLVMRRSYLNVDQRAAS